MSCVSILYCKHGGDHFLLNTLQTMYPSFQEQADAAMKSNSSSSSIGKEEFAEIAKEKGNMAYEGKQWQKAISLYTEAIKLSGKTATYYSNRVAVYLELRSYLQAEADYSTAINLDKKERSTRNTSNRSQQDILHKSGRTSFAHRAETLRGELQRSPTRAEVFQKCYKGKNGYVNAATEEATECLVAMVSQCPENEDAVFREVLGLERKGRKRGMGWTTNPDADITLLRSKIEEMATKLVERDARDK